MDDSTQEQEERTAYLQKNERNRLGTAEWLRGVYPDYESLLAFTADMQMAAVDQHREILRLYTQMDSHLHHNGLVQLLMLDKLPEAALLTLVSRLIDKENNDTLRVAARAIALTRLQQKNTAKNIARKGGLGRLNKLEKLEAETIRLYSAGEWKSAPAAAEKITPTIVAMSREGDGVNLLSTTTKPLEWIRRYIKVLKAASKK
jgi:hypothetical protein